MTHSADQRPLRMLQVANQPGPFYCFLRPLVFELMRRGVEVDVACNRMDARYRKLADAGMSMLPLSVGPWKKRATWHTLGRELGALMRRKSYDICVVHTPAMSWIVRREASRARIPVIAYTAHGLPFFDRQNWLTYQSLLFVEKRCARYTDLLLVVNSVDDAAARRRKLIKRGGKIVRIPGPGIDITRWQNDPSPDRLHALRAELSLAPETGVMTYMGRLMRTKGVLDLVASLARLVERGRDVHLVVAGQGPLADAMRQAASRRGVAERMHLLGWRDDVVALMHLADVLVLPSTYREGLPTVLMEAGASATPVVAYRNRGSDDIIADGETGYSVPANDVAALTDALDRLLLDPELRRTMGQAGRTRVRERFSYPQGVSAQLTAYADALEAKGIDAASLRGPVGAPVFSMATAAEGAEGDDGSGGCAP